MCIDFARRCLVGEWRNCSPFSSTCRWLDETPPLTHPKITQPNERSPKKLEWLFYRYALVHSPGDNSIGLPSRTHSIFYTMSGGFKCIYEWVLEVLVPSIKLMMKMTRRQRIHAKSSFLASYTHKYICIKRVMLFYVCWFGCVWLLNDAWTKWWPNHITSYARTTL